MITPGSSVITRVLIMESVRRVNQPGTTYLMAVVEQRASDSS